MIPLAGFSNTATASQQSFNQRSPGALISGVAYNGNISGLLDAVTAKLGVSWKYEGDKICIYYLETKQFRIETSDAKNNF
ncbi:hypothetical protein [Enterobacter cloacae]|uniref:hypothetical protein n=1 Tax=Enterobacter cloacae TaxID=550 RepID=UPI00388F7F3A